MVRGKEEANIEGGGPEAAIFLQTWRRGGNFRGKAGRDGKHNWEPSKSI